jgi:hypothetical protein
MSYASIVCDDCHAHLSDNGSRLTAVGHKGNRQNPKRVSMVRKERGKRRTLPCSLGKGDAPSRAWRAGHFRFEEHGMGTSNALALAAQN